MEIRFHVGGMYIDRLTEIKYLRRMMTDADDDSVVVKQQLDQA